MVKGRSSLLATPASLLFVALLTFFLAPASPGQDSTRSPGWVVVPIDQYRALRLKAYPLERDQEPSPVDATLTRVDYDLQVASDLATGRASLTVDVLADGWVRVPIPPGLLVRQARLDGKLLSLVSSSSSTSKTNPGQLSALLSHPGRALLQLDIALPIAASAGNESITLPATESGVTRASVQLPRQGVDVRIGGGLLTDQSESSIGSKWLAYGHGTEPLTFTWRRRTEDHRSTQPLRMRGTLTELVSLGEDSTSLSAEANIEVTQGVAPHARIYLPEKVTINQVSGAMVADWEMKPNELVITFLEPVEHSARFVLAGEIRLPRNGAIQVPLLRLLNAERETGGAAVEVLGAGEIKDLKSQGLEEADASDLGEMVSSRQSPSLAAFRFRIGDPAARSLSLNVARYTQQAMLMANVEEARYRVLVSSDGKSLVQARYAIRNNQRNFVKITLPPGATVWSAALSGKPIRPGQSPDGSLLLPLERARGGEDAPEFAVEMVYFTRGAQWNDKGDYVLTLPALDLPVSRTGLLVYHPPLFRVTAGQGSFRTETYADPLSAALGISPVEQSAVVGIGAGVGGGVDVGSANAVGIRAQRADEMKDKSADTTQALVDKFHARSQTGRTAGILPIRVTFPTFGPSVFLVSELTSASQAPTVTLAYEHDKKAGRR